MSLLEDKALRLNLISMVILIITAIYDFMFNKSSLFNKSIGYFIIKPLNNLY